MLDIDIQLRHGHFERHVRIAEDARVLAKENPVAVANILKTWLNGDAV